MKNILVTGADGFIGSHLVEMLYTQSKDKDSLFYGYKIKALSQYNSFNYWGWLEDIECLKDIEVVCGDIRDPHFCKNITRDVEIIFHLAALIAIPFSYVAPDSYVDVNIKGTLNICQSALENNVKRIIHTSTSEVYGTALYVPIDEKHPLQAQSPYSASKISADAMAMSFYNAFNLPLTIARPFNTYGPRQSARAVIPTIITQIANGAKQIRLGDVSPTRDFNYVKDTCLGFLELAKCQKAIGEVVNIGSNYEISIKDTLELIKKLMRSNVEFITENERIRPENSEVFRLWCDNSKIKSLTSFSPQYDIEKGLAQTIEWFSNPLNLKKYKSDIYNI
ncbi:NAD-dependent 4,6-dehydratase LegB [Campylobacter lari]|uniref:NAD-dependent 4,6-dehydratase LegB n=1 Tax=Campylobacter lari TaxID=201 RepID=UPI00057F840A|nr:NAD-dependent 4,6-dehydratase LegB [Campylobacter lari]AJC88743.1 NAD-dependent epimerase/dehydratase, ArnA decarboxylase-like protein [Campylobacter lari subsp. concheus LMG 11760]EAH7187493.1 NAD-dependent epimerase/dehydratase family protein [Campylobacter lari]EAK0437956.1 NAD-dependent epimerase/dehydratase family protein [Campylobacter lari]EEA6125723.1 NAD-dependent epimerase/dehydratase family protein [Campylobacter lari]EEP1956799.1 NAD-dependent epimerase/dehydratase family protei